MQLGDAERDHIADSKNKSLSTNKGLRSHNEVDEDDDDFDIDGQRGDFVKDPYVRKQEMGLTPQQYRSVTLGPENLLVEG